MNAPLLCLIALAAGLAHPPGAPWTRHVVDASSRGADGVKLADLNGDGLPDIATGWEEGGITRSYLHPGHAAVRSPWPAVTVGNTPDVEDALWVDLDGDGRLDVIALCEGKTRKALVHWGPDSADALLDPGAWRQASIPALNDRTQWMYAARMRDAGNAALALGAKGPDAVVGLLRMAGGRDVQQWAWQELSQAGWIMSLKVIDMDGDGLADLLLSDRRGDLRGVRWLRNPGGDGHGAWESIGIGDTDAEVMFLSVADLDGDGLDDILVATKPGEIRWLRRLDAGGRRWETEVIPYPEGVGTAKAVVAGDLNGDGRKELVLNCEQAHGERHGVFGLRRGDADAWEAFAIGGPVGVKFDRIELLDLTGNGRLDILTCEEAEQSLGLGVIWYENPWPPAE